MAESGDAAALVGRLEERFRHLSALLYDTKVPPATLAVEVLPFMADDVRFVDPWQSARGKQLYRDGLAGFHAMFRFHFEFFQVNVQLAPDGRGGRALVDGIMHLEQLKPLLTYPLRTILRYDFTFTDTTPGAEQFLITEHEEMWSFGDMIENVPYLGALYRNVFRPGFSVGFLAASRFFSGRRARRDPAGGWR